MKFCPDCGQPLEVRIPEGDHLPRHICGACSSVHYQNPKIIVGCVPEHAGRILLCRRAIEPRLGYWTIPAGFMENNETLQQGAARESLEEALAEVEIGSPLAIVHVLHAHQVHVMFRARLAKPRFGVGEESLDLVFAWRHAHRVETYTAKKGKFVTRRSEFEIRHLELRPRGASLDPFGESPDLIRRKRLTLRRHDVITGFVRRDAPDQ